MKLIPVQSSNVAEIGYDESGQILFIRFKTSEKIYEHYGVPADVFNQFQTAKSVGSFYARNIKGKYPNQPPQEGQ